MLSSPVERANVVDVEDEVQPEVEVEVKVQAEVEAEVEAAGENNNNRVAYLFIYAFEEQVVVMMPPHTFSFIVFCLLAFAEIKSQGNNRFPFQTHPRAVMVSLTSVFIYGFASAAEFVIYAIRLDQTSVYAIIARLGRLESQRIQNFKPPLLYVHAKGFKSNAWDPQTCPSLLSSTKWIPRSCS